MSLFCVALVPAKMTSVRLPLKNRALLGDQPLLYDSIRAGQMAESIGAVYVSSEDGDVLDMVASMKAHRE